MNFPAVRNRIRQNIKAAGIGGACYDVAYQAINRFLLLRILNCVVIDKVNPEFMKGIDKYTYGFLDVETLIKFANLGSYDLDESAIFRETSKGDRCFGILDGDRLASYGWYSNRPTSISNELTLHFNSEYVYMYHGFTHPDYRGQRLHAIGMTMALNEYLKTGSKGMVSYVDSTNISSLKSVYRMGYEDFGKLFFAKILGKYFIIRSRGCHQYGLRLEKNLGAG